MLGFETVQELFIVNTVQWIEVNKKINTRTLVTYRLRNSLGFWNRWWVSIEVLFLISFVNHEWTTARRLETNYINFVAGFFIPIWSAIRVSHNKLITTIHLGCSCCDIIKCAGEFFKGLTCLYSQITFRH